MCVEQARAGDVEANPIIVFQLNSIALPLVNLVANFPGVLARALPRLGAPSGTTPNDPRQNRVTNIVVSHYGLSPSAGDPWRPPV
ncbi:MAG: hypothetical protein ACRD3T_15590 [Terriglobia bacterium]